MSPNNPEFWFHSWTSIARVLAVGVPSYFALILLLRIRGRRALAKMNTADFVMSVAIGAVFGRVLTADDVALAEALTALFLLLALEYLMCQVTMRHARLQRLINPPPVLLYFRGRLLKDQMHQVGFSEADLHVAAREHGHGSLEGVTAVVVESAGHLSVVASEKEGDASALHGLSREND